MSTTQLPTAATSSWIIHRSASRNGRVSACNISITIFLLESAKQSASSNRYEDLVPVARIDPSAAVALFFQTVPGRARFSPFQRWTQRWREWMYEWIAQGDLSDWWSFLFLEDFEIELSMVEISFRRGAKIFEWDFFVLIFFFFCVYLLLWS